MKTEMDQRIQEAVATQMAAGIIAAISHDDQQAILTASVASTLSSWEIKSAVQKAVAAKAEETALRLVDSVMWSARIEEAVAAGFKLYIAALPDAIHKALVTAMHGTEGDSTYTTKAGLIAKHLRAEVKS